MQDKYKELNNFKIEVRNVFLINSYNTDGNEEVLIIMNWLGHEMLRFYKHRLIMNKEGVKQAQGYVRSSNLNIM